MLEINVDRKELIKVLQAGMEPTQMGMYVREQQVWRDIYISRLADTILESLKRPSWKVVR